MGRKRIHKTDAQVEKQKRKWQDDRNERRRKQYAEDTGYRERIKEEARTRARASSSPIRDRAAQCRESIAGLSELAQKRKLIDSGNMRATITSSELSVMLGLSHQMELYKWQRDGRFPRPTHRALVGRTHANVYYLVEARALLQKMAAHYDVKNYLRAGDEVTESLFGCVAAEVPA